MIKRIHKAALIALLFIFPVRAMDLYPKEMTHTNECDYGSFIRWIDWLFESSSEEDSQVSQTLEYPSQKSELEHDSSIDQTLSLSLKFDTLLCDAKIRMRLALDLEEKWDVQKRGYFFICFSLLDGLNDCGIKSKLFELRNLETEEFQIFSDFIGKIESVKVRKFILEHFLLKCRVLGLSAEKKPETNISKYNLPALRYFSKKRLRRATMRIISQESLSILENKASYGFIEELSEENQDLFFAILENDYNHIEKFEHHWISVPQIWEELFAIRTKLKIRSSLKIEKLLKKTSRFFDIEGSHLLEILESTNKNDQKYWLSWFKGNKNPDVFYFYCMVVFDNLLEKKIISYQLWKFIQDSSPDKRRSIFLHLQTASYGSYTSSGNNGMILCLEAEEKESRKRARA